MKISLGTEWWSQQKYQTVPIKHGVKWRGSHLRDFFGLVLSRETAHILIFHDPQMIQSDIRHQSKGLSVVVVCTFYFYCFLHCFIIQRKEHIDIYFPYFSFSMHDGGQRVLRKVSNYSGPASDSQSTTSCGNEVLRLQGRDWLCSSPPPNQ